MKKLVFVMFVVVLGFAQNASTQAIPKDAGDPKLWPVCKLGGAPIAAAGGQAPAGVKVFPSKGGPVVMSQRDLPTQKKNDVSFITCTLRAGELMYWMNNVPYDVVSNQPYLPIGWEEDNRPVITGAQGERGPEGSQGPQGLTGLQGPKGDPGSDGKDAFAMPPYAYRTDNGGFCSSKKCKVLIGVGVVALGGGGYALYRNWPPVKIKNTVRVGG